MLSFVKLVFDRKFDMGASLGRLVIYTKKMNSMIAFYGQHFGYEMHKNEGDRIIEMRPPQVDMPLLLHPASKGQKEGQSLIKLVFDVKEVSAFCEKAKARGLIFGKVHQADGYVFANAKDPSNNAIQVSSRAFISS